VADHVDRPAEHDLVEVLPTLEHEHQLLHQSARVLCLHAFEMDLVAADDDVGGWERTLDLAEVDVSGPAQCRHDVRAGDNDGVRGCRGAHAPAADGRVVVLIWTPG